ncbi:MAG: hypothetical protein JW702_02510 [Clostridiales bacterium]|nr:hypothetical protein [Clostridiales bacterium]
MEKFLEKLLTDIFKGIIYSVLFGIVGIGVALLVGWPILKGVYVTILVAGAFLMMISIVFLVGTPKSRAEYFLKGKIVGGKIERIGSDSSEEKDFSKKGISPSIIAIVMVVIAFAIEALMH